MLSKFVVASLLALQSAAFMVVPETTSPAHAKCHDWTVQLQCHECPFPVASGESRVVLDDAKDSWLPLNFTTKGNVLSVNDQPIFPLSRRPSELHGVLQRQSDSKVSPPVTMGYGLEFQSVDTPDSDSKLMLFHFTVLDLAGFPVPVSTVFLPTVQSPNGDLAIVKSRADVLPAPRKSWRQCRRNRRCLKHLIFARLRAFIITAKIRALKVAQKFSFKSKGCNRKGGPAGSMHHGRPSHDTHNTKPHTEHPHHNKPMTFAHRFCHILKTVFLPGLIGIVAGISVFIIGVQLACGIGALRAYCHRRRANRANDQEQGEVPEKEALMAGQHEELPPQYHEEDYGKIVIPAEKE